MTVTICPSLYTTTMTHGIYKTFLRAPWTLISVVISAVYVLYNLLYLDEILECSYSYRGFGTYLVMLTGIWMDWTL